MSKRRHDAFLEKVQNYISKNKKNFNPDDYKHFFFDTDIMDGRILLTVFLQTFAIGISKEQIR